MHKNCSLALVALLGVCFATTAASADERPRVALETTKGEIVLELFPDKAPKTVENFLRYVEDDFYDGTIFHRVISNFMIQGGGYTESYDKKPTRDPISNEADNGLDNVRGTVAMARTSDPHSATAQFFINVADNRPLNHRAKTTSRAWGYAVFGKVVEGMENVDAIRAVETGAVGPFPGDAPLEPMVIEQARRVESEPRSESASKTDEDQDAAAGL